MVSSSFIDFLSKELFAIYEEIDEKVRQFKEKTDLKCKRDCGECCAKGKVGISPLEFIPCAVELFKRGELQKYYEKAKKREYGICSFYVPYTLDMKKGYCSIYHLRPATCRLYGFGFKKNKYGVYEPVMCDYLKSEFLKLSPLEKEDLPLPDYDSVMVRIISLYPPLGSKTLKPNLALITALEKVRSFSFSLFPHYDNESHPNHEKYGQNEENGVKG